MQSAEDYFSRTTVWAVAAFVSLASVLLVVAGRYVSKAKYKNLPPHIPSPFPFVGHAVEFGRNPIQFLLKAQEKYGNVFSFTMVGKTFTYLIGAESSALFFNSKNENLNAEEVYSKLITPVFGKGVAYDVPNNVFLEQKKMLKHGLSIAHFRRYIPLIEQETHEYFEHWGSSGERDLFRALSELIILTASRCLHGPEIRAMLDEHVAQLYSDLDGGLTAEAWLLPSWLPLPSFKKRDRANQEMNRIFAKIIQKRHNSPDVEEDDILGFLMNTTYKDGRLLTDTEITGMLIGLLMAGQHTSSTTSAWLGFYLAKDSKLQDRVYSEQVEVYGKELAPVNYDLLKETVFLDNCLKETLRLRPPIMTMMRMVKTPQEVCGYTVPPGHQVCVSPTVNQRLKESWTDADSFNPDRFQQADASNSEKFSYIPFGAGRHRCIGESFAYIQIKTIWSVLIRKYQFQLVNDHFPPVNYQTMIHTPTNPVIHYSPRHQ